MYLLKKKCKRTGYNMTYAEKYQHDLEKYNHLLKNYEELITSPKYHEIISTLPFEFLKALHLCETLTLYDSLKKKPRMKFSSLEEVKVFYKNLTSFNNTVNGLLEEASYLVKIGKWANNINDFIDKSAFLNDSFYIVPNDEVINLARRCLLEIPKYPQLLTKKFRWNFIESAIYSLKLEDLKELVTLNIIKPNDLDHISLIEEKNNYQEKIKELCILLNHPEPIIASYDLKLKAVTFDNEDGSSRQENLKALKFYAENHPNEQIPLTTNIYTYVPEIGAPEPAISVAWDGKIIGNIARVAAEEIVTLYNSPQMKATLNMVSGSREKDMKFGCNIHLEVIAPKYVKEESLDADIEEER